MTERDGATVAFEAVHAIGLYGRRFRGGHVPGADDGEVAPVQGSHIGQLEPLGDCDGCVDRTERQVGVGAHELGHARQVGGGGGEVLGLGLPRSSEGRPRLNVGAFFRKPARLDNDRGGSAEG